MEHVHVFEAGKKFLSRCLIMTICKFLLVLTSTNSHGWYILIYLYYWQARKLILAIGLICWRNVRFLSRILVLFLPKYVTFYNIILWYNIILRCNIMSRFTIIVSWFYRLLYSVVWYFIIWHNIIWFDTNIYCIVYNVCI